MRIGIVGLKPRQVADLKAHQVHHDLYCYDNDRFTRFAVGLFARDKDQVLVLQKLVPRHTLDNVPRSKQVMIGGSLSGILRHLDSLPKTEPKTVTPVRPVTVPIYRAAKPVVAKVQQPVPIASVQTPALVKTVEVASEEVAVILQPGYAVRYTTPVEEVLTIPPNENGTMSYSILLATKVGDIVRFLRPEKLDYILWRDRLKACRTYYFKRFDLVIEAHFFKTYVDVLVIEPSTKPQNKVEDRAAMDGTAWQLSDPTAPADPVGTQVSADIVIDETGVDNIGDAYGDTIDQSIPVANDPVSYVPGVSLVFQSESEKEFWQKVYLIQLTHSGSVDMADTAADHAVLSFRVRGA